MRHVGDLPKGEEQSQRCRTMRVPVPKCHLSSDWRTTASVAAAAFTPGPLATGVHHRRVVLRVSCLRRSPSTKAAWKLILNGELIHHLLESSRRAILGLLIQRLSGICPRLSQRSDPLGRTPV